MFRVEDRLAAVTSRVASWRWVTAVPVVGRMSEDHARSTVQQLAHYPYYVSIPSHVLYRTQEFSLVLH